MLGAARRVRIETERMTLRLPQHGDFRAWTGLREQSAPFLTPWEPVWAADHLSRKAFTNRVNSGFPCVKIDKPATPAKRVI